MSEAKPSVTEIDLGKITLTDNVASLAARVITLQRDGATDATVEGYITIETSLGAYAVHVHCCAKRVTELGAAEPSVKH